MLKKQSKRKFITAGILLGGSCLAASHLAKTHGESDETDKGNPYLNRDIGKDRKRVGCYEKYIKPGLDKGLSFAGLIVLAPVYAVISAAIYLDNPGPVFFTQKRVGKDGHFFELHKFRTMKMNTPHDIPTHQLENPEQYITRVGGFLRKHSLDELPQIWDIFRGKMSVIGPRPALWNQEDLIAEREKYGANSAMPGLTGWAQINGRDELEIAEKAALDGEYVRRLRAGNLKGMLFDLRCFFGTVKSVAGSDGVVEGGTGEIRRADNGLRPEESSRKNGRRPGGSSRENRREKNAGTRPGNGGFSSDRGNRQTHHEIPVVDPADAGFEDYGYKKTFCIDKNTEGKVLITGAGSYVGESFRNYAAEHYPNLTIDTVDMIDSSWREKSFQGYDCVFHVAGIAHADVGKVSEEEKRRYYAVNTDLAIETAEKAKADGVTQFILMSSMIVYGDSAPYGKEKVIDAHTVPAPANFYGDSKWQADKGVRKLQSDGFHVAVIRAPMIYGKGSKGNYPVLSKMAKKLPVFPKVENQRSMLYIENLCEFLCLLVMSGEGGIYFPQNGEYGCTSELVREIGAAAGKKVRLAGWLKPAVVAGGSMPGRIGRLADKAFGNCVYKQRISHYKGIDYQKIELGKSICRTENVKDANTDQGMDYNAKEGLVSIIMPAYNCENFISSAIESVIRQTYQDWELIIVDDGSNDSTSMIVQKYMFMDERIYCLRNAHNCGAASSRNRAIEYAHGQYMAFLDSDDVWTANKLEKQIKFMKENGYLFTCTSYDKINENGLPIGKIVNALTINYEGMLKRCPGNSTVIYDASKLGKYKIPLIKKRNDYVMWLKVIKDAKKLNGLNCVLSSHRIVSNSISSNKVSLIKYHWIVYTDIEKIGIMKSMYLIVFWVAKKIFGIR